MEANIIVSGLVFFLHDLFTVIWIGGLIALGVTTFPAARKALGKGPEMKALMDAIMKRQSILVYVSMLGLILTGLLQARRAEAFTGLFSFGNPYTTVLSLKHLLVAVMIAISLYRSLALGKAGASGREERLSVILLYANVASGVVVLVLSGLLAALA